MGESRKFTDRQHTHNMVPSVTAETAVYAVIGNPIAHSMSPIMHNAAFKHLGIDGVYVGFRVVDLKAAMIGFKALGVNGISVTIPHKTEVMKYLDRMDPMARAIGAVNTVVLEKERFIGYNTDGTGAVKALKEKGQLKKRTVAILGAGGAARAIGYAVKKEGGKITIVNRSKERGEQLADDLNGNFAIMAEYSGNDSQVLINTTPVGMFPSTKDMPVDPSVLKTPMIVMDAIYNPLKTTFLKTAESLGCTTINGLEMFVNQGAAQFELWTGQPASIEIMKIAVLESMKQKS